MADLIDRQAAIDAVMDTDWYHQNKNKDMVHGANSSEHQAWYKAEDVYKALENVPSAQPEGIKCGELSEEDYEKMAELMRKQPLQWIPTQPEIIRCGECKHSFLHDNGEKISRICGLTRMCGTTPDDWFCADAERSEE